MFKRYFLLIGALLVVAGAIFYVRGGTFSPSYGAHEEKSTYVIDVSVPRTTNNALNEAVTAYVNARAKEFAEMYAPEMFSEADLENLGFNDGRQYELSITGEAWDYNNLSGISVLVYTYTGGAHGSTVYVPFMNDDVGTPVSLRDLFVPNAPYLERIAGDIQPTLREELEEGDMYVEEFFIEGTKPSEGNFFVDQIDDGGITFVFQEYQVAPYAAGTPRTTVSLTSLTDILNPTYFGKN
ncbi:MAG: DUF3298 domain-containing protein [Patescibacteria group bacterium]